MTWLEALALGILQGLTEYLPVSSSGHLMIGSALFGITDPETTLPFAVVVHIATVFSTLIILNKEIVWLFKGLFNFKNAKSDYKGAVHFLNNEQNYALNIFISMITIGIVGICFKDAIEATFSNIIIVGICLIITALLLTFSYYTKPRQKEYISVWDALIIGLSQALACLPGLSRSGTTIATGILIGNKKEQLAQFSFLMVIPPILGEALLDVVKIFTNGFSEAFCNISTTALIVGFLAAFLSGCLACKVMINIVKKGKLIYFAIYCAIIGIATLIFSLI